MNDRWIVYIVLGFIGMFGTGCHNEFDSHMSDTGFRIALVDDAEVVMRSAPNELARPLVNHFKLKITNQESGSTIYEGNYTDQTISAPEGKYELLASYGTNPVLALDAPYYEGRAEGSVTAKKTVPVSITCAVANALTSVTFVNEEATDCSFEKDFQNYAIRVSIIDADHSYAVDMTKEGESAYYRAGSKPLFTFVGTLKDGTPFSQPLTHPKFSDPATFAAKAHCKISLRMGKIQAGLKVNIEKVEVKKVSISETIPAEWLPKPKVEGFAGNNSLSIVETERVTADQASLRIKTATPLQELKMRFYFQDERFAALNKTVEKDYYLLSDQADKERIESVLGIQLPSLGATDAFIDLSSPANRLLTKNGVKVENTIELDVKANNRWSSEDKKANLTYKLVCIKPEFSISVDPCHCWSWEFLINEAIITSGDAEVIRKDLKYQYYDGKEWKDCRTREGVAGRLQQFPIDKERKNVYLKDNPSERTYKIRALYRGAIASSEETVTLEEPWQLPNSDMEEWHAKSLGEFVGVPNFWNKYRYFDFLPYKENESNIFWAANNERSRAYSVSRVHVTSSPCVSYAENNKHGGNRSALLYTSGHGGGFASTSLVLYPESAFAGSLFIGSYQWTGDKEIITAGKTFTSRPSKMTFWYKYIPKNSDAFKVYVELKNGTETVATGEFVPTRLSAESAWEEATVDVVYVDQPKEATSIYVQFLSTDKNSFTADDFDKNKAITFPVMGGWNAHIGSILYIDDISLIYDK